jgi:hypothetical protein
MTQDEFDEAMRRTIERMGLINPKFTDERDETKPKRIQPEPHEIGYT